MTKNKDKLGSMDLSISSDFKTFFPVLIELITPTKTKGTEPICEAMKTINDPNKYLPKLFVGLIPCSKNIL